ncbi:hypothetical protein PPYR_04319 [Photinus pyralis]|uniref:Alpha-1,3/1,6-mannosyltransferase ALG2 n=1 Tax=Photinus pyralis TaxID=7054 RepID=A0A1Y1LUM4_PHOPY|nr:alpha-1,3/1,6-mannosyltransferase ALG2 [Photinus pyralis]KAB0802133.1 hypothetical protein PPYR_04319 [Photinus pyralis]
MMPVKKPKIVFVHPDLGIGGAERLVLDVAVALSEKNEVSFVTNHFNKHHAFEELCDGQFPVRVIGNWIPRGLCGIFQALFSYLRMIYLALFYVLFINKSEKPDLFFIDQIPMAVPFIKLAGGKVIYYCHHPDLLASTPGGFLKRLYRLPINWLELQCTALSDVILVNSKYTKKVFQKTFPEITKNISILYPTISSSYQALIANSHFKNAEEIAHIPKETFVFLSINRFHPAKKLELAMDALEAAQTKLSSSEWGGIHLIMAGGYDPDSSINAFYFAKLVKLCENKNLMAKVTFLKSPSDNLKADLLLRCNCLLYTPINEHFGIVPLEAMTAGKPVIACNSGGPCETVQDGVTGYLCEPTGDSVANAITKIIKDDNAERMGLMGKARLEQYFSYESFVNHANKIVDKFLRGEDPTKTTSDSLNQNNQETEPSTEEHSNETRCPPTSPISVVEEHQNTPASNRSNSFSEPNHAESANGQNSISSPNTSFEENSTQLNSSHSSSEKAIQRSSDNLNLSNGSEPISDENINNVEAAEDHSSDFVSPTQVFKPNIVGGSGDKYEKWSPSSLLDQMLFEERLHSLPTEKGRNPSELSQNELSVSPASEAGNEDYIQM